jgi:hypothetical protein
LALIVIIAREGQKNPQTGEDFGNETTRSELKVLLERSTSNLPHINQLEANKNLRSV